MKTPAVLLVSGKTWGSYLGILQSLRRKGVPVHIVSWGVSQAVLRKSRHYDQGREFPAADEATRLADLLGYAESARLPGKPVLFYCADGDALFVVRNKTALETRYTVIMKDPAVCAQMLSKRTADPLARANGLTAPRIWCVAAPEDVTAAADQCDYPVVLKPSSGRTTGGVAIKADIASTRDELVATASRIVEGGGECVVQDYIEGGDDCVEFFLFYRALRDGTVRGCTGRKLRQFPAGAGIMAFGVTETIDDIRRAGEAFLRGIDYAGLGGLEFKRSGGKAYFIEMSLRSEMFHKIAIDAGVDLPWIAYADACGLEAPPAARQRDGVHYINETPFLRLMLQNPKRLLRDIPRLFGGKVRFGLFTFADPLPFLYKTATGLVGLLRRR